MRTRRLRGVFLSALLTACLAGCVGGTDDQGADETKGWDESKKDKTPKTTKAATPEEAVAFVVAASKAGSYKGVLEQLSGGPRKLTEAAIATFDAISNFETGLNYKVGYKPRKGPSMPDPKEELISVIKMQIVKKRADGEGKVKLTIKSTKVTGDGKEETREEEWGAVKEDDAWKLIPPEMPGGAAGMKATLEKLEKTRAIYQTKTKEVADGKIKTREAALKALEEALKEVK